MAQEGEQYGQGDPPSPFVQEWPERPLVSAAQPPEAPSSPEPAPGEPAHRRPADRLPRGIRHIAGALALVLLGAGIYFGIDRWIIGDGQQSAAPTGCAGQRLLRLAVAPEVVPLVEWAASDVDGATCPTVAITPLEPGQTGSILTGGKLDGMVPASSALLRLAPSPQASAGPSAASAAPASASPDVLLVDKAASLVRSPIVVAVPKPAAGAFGWPQRQAGWAELATATVGGKLRFSMGNPMRDAAGLLAMLSVHAAMGKTTPDQGIAQMRALTLRSRLADASADPAVLLQRLESLSDPAAAAKDIGAFPVTEQAVWAYQTKKPGISLAAIYPDGLMEADYPLVLAPAAASDRHFKDLATRLVERFHSGSFAATVREHGFRPVSDTMPTATPTNPPLADGLLARYPAAAATPSDPILVTSRAAQWARYERKEFQVLILLDASASMNDQVRDRSGSLTTKAALLRTAGVQAAELFGLDTSVGVWLFATPAPNIPPYVEAVSLGPLDAPLRGIPRREAVRRMAQSYTAYEKAGTPLYETVLRGVDAMRKLSKPGTVTMVVALTDGRDQDTAFAMPRTEFLSRLSTIRDPQRPVPVFCIGYGADADMAALNEISRATGGRAAASNDPADLASAMAQIFLAAHAAQ
ncbi:hypothetical protein Rhe02_62670 [Rhizocola hellebori]|uniref:VWFA domain-containing protein n=1 Tax=Rhizocola hellebori TaxID=1392758 RepID=A0A8J3VJ24_9ACTN|nr:VWA domain-containing protein [Rhizocola hellebori]GIH08200.1 hypothetical protein Rhe02_62670 [Rhizocola hellebori]